MSNKKPVIVYGASGYSGGLIAEFLRDSRSRLLQPDGTRNVSKQR